MRNGRYACYAYRFYFFFFFLKYLFFLKHGQIWNHFVHYKYLGIKGCCCFVIIIITIIIIAIIIITFNEGRFSLSVCSGAKLSWEQSLSFLKKSPFQKGIVVWEIKQPVTKDVTLLKSKLQRIWAVTSENVPSDMCCAPSEDSDQIAHSRSLIWIFTGRISDSQGCNVSSCGQRRLWSD